MFMYLLCLPHQSIHTTSERLSLLCLPSCLAGTRCSVFICRINEPKGMRNPAGSKKECLPHTACIHFWTSTMQVPQYWARISRLYPRRKTPKLTTGCTDSELLSWTALPRNALLRELVIIRLLTSTSFLSSSRFQISSWEGNSTSYQELNVTQKHGCICT